MNTSKISIVVPTIRENSINRFISEWFLIFKKYKVNLIIVEDNPEKSFDIDLKEKFKIFQI